jgi:hypothetical protein
MQRLTGIQLSLNVEDVLEGQGIAVDRARSAIVASAQETLSTLPDLLDPTAVYDIVPVKDFHHRTIELEDGGALEGPLAARALAGAEKVVLAVCTIGPALEAHMKRLFAEDPVTAMALDGAGTAALRKISAAVVGNLQEIAADHDWGVGMRAQPGQEGWSIWQQQVIFERLPTDSIGVRLTDSCLMVPRKSVSFAIGMGPHMRPDAVACDFCSKSEGCLWRVKAQAST